MDYKVELQNNNVDLQSILDTINNLPNASGGGSTELVTATISDEQAEWSDSVTVEELVGAKYFVIQGNPMADKTFTTLSSMDASIVYQLVYINGISIITAPTYYPGNNRTAMRVYTITSEIFDSSTGTINGAVEDGFMFARLETDTYENDNAYTVYRLG